MLSVKELVYISLFDSDNEKDSELDTDRLVSNVEFVGDDGMSDGLCEYVSVELGAKESS